MKSCLIKIPFLAYDVDVASGYLTGGLPSMTAIDGLMHSIERNFNKIDGLNLKLNEWSFFIDKITYNVGKPRYIGYEKSITDKDKLINTPGREDKLATIKGFFIANVEHDEDYDLDLIRQKNKLIPIFNRLRLSGGSLWIDPTKDEVLDGKLHKNKNKLRFYEYSDNENCVEQFIDILKSVDSHSIVIQDRTSLIEERSIYSLEKTVELFSFKKSSQLDPDTDIKLYTAIVENVEDNELFLLNLELILANESGFFSKFQNDSVKALCLEIDPKIKVNAEKPTKKVKDRLLPSFRSLQLKLEVMRNKFGLTLNRNTFVDKYNDMFVSELDLVDEFLIPVNIGYHAISERKERKGMRLSDLQVKHIYAEPVLGLARPRKVCSVRINALESQDIKKYFWSNSKKNLPDFESNEYIVKAPQSLFVPDVDDDFHSDF